MGNKESLTGVVHVVDMVLPSKKLLYKLAVPKKQIKSSKITLGGIKKNLII